MIIHLESSSACDPRSKPPVLLCVDDAKIALLARAHILSRHGYEVIATNSPEEALCALWKHRIDAIVTDYEMPGMNGDEFAAHVKRGACSCPILLYSGCSDIPSAAMRFVDAFAPKGQPVSHFLGQVDSFVAQLCAPAAQLNQNLGQAA